MTVKEISQRAKKIRAQYPNKKWTDCIKQASKELKSGNRNTGKVGATKKTKSLKNTVTFNMANNEARELSTKLRNKMYVMKKNNTIYTTVGKGEGTVLAIWDMGNKIGATKSVPANQTRRKQSTKKPVSKHKDIMSHNVRINVLSGMQGAERPVTLNGLKNLTKGAWYIYNDKTNTVFKYIGKDTKGGGYPLIFDTYTKKSSGSYIFTGRWEYSLELMKYLHRVKKPTAKELSIGHLKLIK